MRPRDVLAATLVLAACHAAAPPRRPPPAAPFELRAEVFRRAADLPPAVAAKLPAGLDLDGRALVLPGGWLPSAADSVRVIDLTSTTRLHFVRVAPAEILRGEIVGDTVRIEFAHVPNVSGWCCSGGVQPPPHCRGDVPPMPTHATDGDPVRLWLFVVPSAVADRVVVERTVDLCSRQ
jgi:hypothetical protein